MVVLPAPLGPTIAANWPGAVCQRDVIERRGRVTLGVWIPERHVLELDPAESGCRITSRCGALVAAGGRTRRELVRIRGIANRGNEVEVLEDAGEQGAGGLQVERDPHQAEQREE
jgi:hypothetical protein